MAYCPNCGREQRCGCEKCHTCGIELVERPSTPEGSPLRQRPGSIDSRNQASRADTGVSRAGLDQEATQKVRGPGPARASTVHGREAPWTGTVSAARATPPEKWVPAVLIVLGVGILLITLIEAIGKAASFPSIGAGANTADAIKRVGYYLGSILYVSSARALTGFGLLIAGMLWHPDWPFEAPETRRQAARGVGLLMGALSMLCVVAAILLVLPVGASTLALANLLPATWAATCIILAMGASLLLAGYILVRGPGSAGAGDSRPRRRERSDPSAGSHIDQAGAGTRKDSVKTKCDTGPGGIEQ